MEEEKNEPVVKFPIKAHHTRHHRDVRIALEKEIELFTMTLSRHRRNTRRKLMIKRHQRKSQSF